MEHNQITKEWIAKQRAICDAATPGPWESAGVYVHDTQIHKESSLANKAACICETKPEPSSDRSAVNDSRFIAAARTALPAALDALEAAYAEIARLTAERDAAVCDMFGCMSTQGQCVRCKKRYYCDGTDDDKFSPLCKNKSHCYAWEWRGLHADNTDAPTVGEDGKEEQ